MEERGAVSRARGELERRRQEAYKVRAAATIKIQRWYRQRRASASRACAREVIATDDGGVRSPSNTSSLGTKSTTLDTISHHNEARGNLHTYPKCYA